ncbi:MAG TPA: hypothetical protein ENH00_09230 [Actinobacteria bacterium]|nr:hypothetical protein BMS3Bbin01_03037 [bacterium BMS3Bbin01]HDH26360.1 hypothetical protein [Actinomycetota bacterium]
MTIAPPVGAGPSGQHERVLSGRLVRRVGSLATGTALLISGLALQVVVSLSRLLEGLGSTAVHIPVVDLHPTMRRWLMACSVPQRGLRVTAQWVARPLRATRHHTTRIDQALLRIHYNLTRS